MVSRLTRRGGVNAAVSVKCRRTLGLEVLGQLGTFNYFPLMQ